MSKEHRIRLTETEMKLILEALRFYKHHNLQLYEQGKVKGLKVAQIGYLVERFEILTRENILQHLGRKYAKRPKHLKF